MLYACCFTKPSFFCTWFWNFKLSEVPKEPVLPVLLVMGSTHRIRLVPFWHQRESYSMIPPDFCPSLNLCVEDRQSLKRAGPNDLNSMFWTSSFCEDRLNYNSASLSDRHGFQSFRNLCEIRSNQSCGPQPLVISAHFSPGPIKPLDHVCFAPLKPSLDFVSVPWRCITCISWGCQKNTVLDYSPGWQQPWDKHHSPISRTPDLFVLLQAIASDT